MNIAEIWADTLDLLGRAWWVEVLTAQPKCTYYFGPFSGVAAATTAMQGYIEDLESESAQGIRSQVKRCKPSQLTIGDSNSKFKNLGGVGCQIRF